MLGAREESCKIKGFRNLECLNRPGGCYIFGFRGAIRNILLYNGRQILKRIYQTEFDMEEGLSCLEHNDDDVVEFGKTSVRIGTLIKSIEEFYKNQHYAHGDQLINHVNSSSLYIDKKIFFQSSMHGGNYNYTKLFDQGLECQILQLGAKKWNKGKMRIKLSVEFYLEEPQDTENPENTNLMLPLSPLDDLRQIINK